MPTWDFVCKRCESIAMIHIKSEMLSSRRSVDPEIFLCPECGCDEIQITSFENSDEYPQHVLRFKLEELGARVKALEDTLEYEYANSETH